MIYKTIMWREYPMIPGRKTYRINTTDPSVAKRMKQRKDFEPAVIYYNVNVWDFRTDKYSKKDAIRTMQRVTRQRIKYNALMFRYALIFTRNVNITR